MDRAEADANVWMVSMVSCVSRSCDLMVAMCEPRCSGQLATVRHPIGIQPAPCSTPPCASAKQRSTTCPLRLRLPRAEEKGNIIFLSVCPGWLSTLWAECARPSPQPTLCKDSERWSQLWLTRASFNPSSAKERPPPFESSRSSALLLDASTRAALATC